jgi:hypothetical protein
LGLNPVPAENFNFVVFPLSVAIGIYMSHPQGRKQPNDHQILLGRCSSCTVSLECRCYQVVFTCAIRNPIPSSTQYQSLIMTQRLPGWIRAGVAPAGNIPNSLRTGWRWEGESQRVGECLGNNRRVSGKIVKVNYM